MALYSTAPSVSAGALTTPVVLTAAASDTFLASGCFGATGMRMRVITTGTVTAVAVQDPGVTPSGNAGTVVGLNTPATGTRELLVPLSAVNTASGVATVTFTPITGVTYEIYKA
jgi:hypothetical protein